MPIAASLFKDVLSFFIMNQYQWATWSIGFLFLGAVLQLFVVPFDGGSIVWAVGRIYALATWVSLTLFAVCMVCSRLQARQVRPALKRK